MTFFGIEYHDYHEHLITKEWIWFQTQSILVDLTKRFKLEEVEKVSQQRSVEIAPYLAEET